MKAMANVASRLAEAIGVKRVIAAEEELAGYAIDGLVPGAIVRPGSGEEVAEVVRFAAAEKLAVVPVGSRSKCEVGMPAERYDIAMDMTAMREIAHYDAGDLTLSADAGIALRELEVLLKEKGQFLPLAVPCFESTTVGGAIASGIDSALRMQYGGARDFLIGAEFVDGTGNLCRSGGRVVKNVTGYDLHKLLIGSQGTLGVITRLNFRTSPLPATFGAHLAGFASNEGALHYRDAVDKSGLPLANLEVLNPVVAGMIRAILQRSGDAVPPELGRDEWYAHGSYEGNEEVVRRIGAELQRIARESGAVQQRILERAEDEALGGMLREAYEWLRWASPATVICRLAVPEVKPEVLAQLLRLGEAAALRTAVLVRAAGIVYFTVLAESDDEAGIGPLEKVADGAEVLARAENGYSALLHAPLAIKKRAAGHRRNEMDKGLQLRVKQAFDPLGVFVPGRVVGGI